MQKGLLLGDQPASGCWHLQRRSSASPDVEHSHSFATSLAANESAKVHSGATPRYDNSNDPNSHEGYYMELPAMGRTLLSILILFCAEQLPQISLAYPAPVDFDGSILRWDIGPDDPPIGFEVVAAYESDRDEFQSIVADSAELWNSVPNSYFRYAEVQDGETAQVTVNLSRAIDGSSASSGYAIFDSYQDKKPSHCSIYILIDDSFSQNSIAKTILHELGHCVGLGHSLIPEAIMSYQLAKNQFALDIDDEAAVTRLYPASGAEPKLPPGCSIGPERLNHLASLVLLLLPLLIPNIRQRTNLNRQYS